MATKTVTLNGAEQQVDELGGLNALIVNNTTEPLYASAKAGVVPYADGVIEIQSGEAQTLPDSNGTVYLLGSGGRAQLTGIVNFKMPSRRSGGGGVTEAEVNGIVTEKIAEVVANAPEDFDTLKEIADWIDGHEDSAAAMNSEIKANTADISDIWTEQETQNSSIFSLQEKMEQKANISEVSNPNLLDNPDFRINQRGQSEYTTIGYTVDRWLMPTSGLGLKVFSDHIEVGKTDNRSGKILEQRIAMSEIDLKGKTVTFSTYAEGAAAGENIRILSGESPISAAYMVSGINSTTAAVPADCEVLRVIYHTESATPHMFGIFWAKLEFGDKATPFVPPHPATELLKCQRYYQTLGRGTVATIKTNKPGTNGCVNLLKSFSVPMRTAPNVTLLGDPKWRDASTYIPKSNEEMRIDNVSISSEGIGWLELVGGYDLASYGINHFISADADNFIGLSADL